MRKKVARLDVFYDRIKEARERGLREQASEFDQELRQLAVPED